ncbi:hypothetical protein BASA81_008067 [Batrachochytrium salamandrivorans]|nr:hypothetical protein BASA81_008067 [Batrachochytrium salamandrivorans]
MRFSNKFCAFLLVALVMASTTVMAVPYTKYDGVGFSGSGFLFVYHMGVLKGLQNAEFVPQRVSKLSGLSGGALVAASQCTKTTPKKTKKEAFAVLEFCSKDAPYYCFGKLDQVLNGFLEKVIPQGSVRNCDRKLFVDVSRVQNLTGSSCTDCVPTNLAIKLVSHYRSRADLITVLRATSFLAQGVSSPSSCTLDLRDKPMCDGGYANRNIPCPVGSKRCVKVSSYVNPNPSASIYPGMRGESTLPIPSSMWNSYSLNAVVINMHKEAIFQLGLDDAKYWLNQNA